MESGEEYLHYDNYKKASEEYGEAKKLAEGLKHQEEAKEADRCLKLSEQVLLADEAMGEGEYQKAQELYRKARRLSEEAGNVGRDYLDARMKEAEGYLAVFDLMELGEKREGFGDREGAIEAYREARDCAAALYYSEGKEEALRKQAAVEEAVEKDSQKAKAYRPKGRPCPNPISFHKRSLPLIAAIRQASVLQKVDQHGDYHSDHQHDYDHCRYHLFRFLIFDVLDTNNLPSL